MRIDEGLEERKEILKPRSPFTGRNANGRFSEVDEWWADQGFTGRWRWI